MMADGPTDPAALFEAAERSRQAGDVAAAIETGRRLAGLVPGHAQVRAWLGSVLLEAGDASQALQEFDAAAAVDAALPGVAYSRGLALQRLGRPTEALAAYEEAIAADQDDVAALANRGSVLLDLRRPAEALDAYDAALARAPDAAQLHYNRGRASAALDRAEEALAAFDCALAGAPDNPDIHNSRGNALLRLRRPADALAAYDRALALDPAYPDLAGTAMHVAQQLCAWDGLAARVSDVCAGIDAGRRVCLPFYALAVETGPARQRRCAEIHAAGYSASPRPAAGPRDPSGRIRIGYFSSDFYDHAIGHLIAGLLETHDRAKVELTGFAIGPARDDAMTRRIENAVGSFVRTGPAGDEEIAALARSRRIDIAVDLNGYTRNSQSGIFAAGAAPVQVAFLGYPGTTGAPFIDYMIADRVIVPPAQRAHYSEAVVFMPGSYQCNDDARPVPDGTVSRRALGLPEDGFVFCCFNNVYKIGADIFDVWMRLLRAIDGSVLWLVAANDAARSNLQKAAAARGIDPARIVFAPRISPADHLARHAAADLFLDTPRYNAHTTASDALWAGLPVLTCPDDTFAGRVGASLVAAAGLPELVAESLDAYEAMALDLARDVAALAGLKDKLVAGRDSCALFDTAAFARDLETAYREMWRRHLDGAPPSDISVADLQRA